MEFENLQIEVPKDNSSQYMGVKVYEKRYHNHSKDFVIGFDPNSKEALERKKIRANRFGSKTIQPVTAPLDLESDTRKFGKINIKDLEWPEVPFDVKGEIRYEAIHLHGVTNMSTTDVFDYFTLFGPETIEWIDDISCNVIWDDRSAALNALDTLSKSYGKLLQMQRQAAHELLSPDSRDAPPPPPVVIKEEEDEIITHYENQIIVPEEEEEIDPKGVWRVGIPYRENQLFLRYATKTDKKMPGAAKRSEYYLKYGRDPQNTRNGFQGILSNSRKRKLKEMQQLANERFKTKEPDVKIVELAELKSEGIISKMEVDEFEEPIIKRITKDFDNPGLTHERIPPMTMVADKVEVQQRFGDRNVSDDLYDRLGTPLPEDTKDERTSRIQDRLGTPDRVGQKNSSRGDARNEMYNKRCTQHNNQMYISGEGYIDDNGDYHDTYQAYDIKEEKKEEKVDIDDLMYEHRDGNRGNSSVRDRLGTPREETPSISGDLRDRLRHRGGVRNDFLNYDIKEEEGEKVNLCIEIKQEIPEDPTPPPHVDEVLSDFEF